MLWGPLSALLCATASLAMRPQSPPSVPPSDPLEGIDPSMAENPAAPKLQPFEIDLTLKNEEAALEKSKGTLEGKLLYDALPQEVSLDDAASGITADLQQRLQKESGLTCSIQKEGTHGKQIKLIMDITSYELGKVLPEKIAQDFASSMSALPAELAALKVQNMYDDVLAKVKDFLEAKWLEKIPQLLREKLSESKVEADLSIPPKPKPNATTAKTELAPMEAILRVELEKRLPLAQAAKPDANPEEVQKMPQPEYLALIQPRLQEQAARAIRDTLGDALPFKITAECDADFGGLSKHSFWLRLSLSNFDEVKALEKLRSPSADHAQKLLSLLEQLTKCGVLGLDGAATNIRTFLRSGELKDWHVGLVQRMGQLLGTPMQEVNRSSYNWLQKEAASGVCCRSERSGKSKQDEVFWIAAEVTAGGEHTHDGGCPALQETVNPPCVATAKSGKKVVLHHRPYTECFNLPDLKDGKAPERIAPLVSSNC